MNIPECHVRDQATVLLRSEPFRRVQKHGPLTYLSLKDITSSLSISLSLLSVQECQVHFTWPQQMLVPGTFPGRSRLCKVSRSRYRRLREGGAAQGGGSWTSHSAKP
jgi:hypothetical protein